MLGVVTPLRAVVEGFGWVSCDAIASGSARVWVAEGFSSERVGWLSGQSQIKHTAAGGCNS